MLKANAQEKQTNQGVLEAVNAPVAAQPAGQLNLGPPPSRKLTDFLAPVAGESPENTITKLIQGIGLMASGIVGLKRGDATAALAGLHGALKGWQEGDKERADRHFADWSAASLSLERDWERRHREYRDALENHDMNVSQALQVAKLKAIENGHDVAVTAFDVGELDKATAFLERERDQLMKFSEQRLRLKEMIQRGREHDETMKEIRAQTQKMHEANQAALVGTWDKGALRLAAQDYITDGKLPNIVTAGKAGAAIKGQIMEEVEAMLRERNIDPMEIPGIRAEVKAARGSLTDLYKFNRRREGAIRRMDAHLELLEKISAEVPRTEVRAVNEAIIAGQRDYKGSEAAARYVFQSLEAAMEYVQTILPPGAVGGEQTQARAAEALARGLSDNQVRGIADQMRQNSKRTSDQNRIQEKELLKTITTWGGRLTMPAPPSGEGPQPGDLVWDVKQGKAVPFGR